MLNFASKSKLVFLHGNMLAFMFTSKMGRATSQLFNNFTCELMFVTMRKCGNVEMWKSSFIHWKLDCFRLVLGSFNTKLSELQRP